MAIEIRTEDKPKIGDISLTDTSGTVPHQDVPVIRIPQHEG
jgi:hypothetical protein